MKGSINFPSQNICQAFNTLNKQYKAETLRKVLKMISQRKLNNNESQYSASTYRNQQDSVFISPRLARLHNQKPSPLLIHLSQTHTISQIGCGKNFLVALTTQNVIFSCGDNSHGQLGRKYGNGWKQFGVVELHGKLSDRIRGISCGDTHAVAYGQKECYGWGEHLYGALGYSAQQVINSWMLRRVPVFVGPHEELLEVVCGSNTTIFNISTKYYGLGDNRVGQLGQSLKKQILQPQPIQINTSSNPDSKTKPKLSKIITSNNITIGLCNENKLYGAGQLGRLNIRQKKRGLLSSGLNQLEWINENNLYSNSGQIKQNKLIGTIKLNNQKNLYSVFEDVQDFYCGHDLLVKFRSGDFMWFAEQGCRKVNLQGDVMRVCQAGIFYKNVNRSVYMWGALSNVGPQLILDEVQDNWNVTCTGDGQIISIVSNEGQKDCIFNINYENQKQLKNYSIPQSILLQKSQICQTEQALDHKTPTLSSSPTTAINSLLSTSCSSNQPNSQFRIQQLQKEVQQQKQIIRLYEEYVVKLEKENEKLRKKLNKQTIKERLGKQRELDEEPEDCMGDGLTLLKVMIGDMIKQCAIK